jgi:hypothetical protein
MILPPLRDLGALCVENLYVGKQVFVKQLFPSLFLPMDVIIFWEIFFFQQFTPGDFCSEKKFRSFIKPCLNHMFSRKRFGPGPFNLEVEFQAGRQTRRAGC